VHNSPSLIRRGLVGLAAIGLAFAALGTAQATASTTAAAIDTYGAWDGAYTVQAFGCPDSTTYGETITVPSGKKKITKVTFPWINLVGSGSFKTRGYVYAWNGTGATGSAIAATKAKTISYVDGVFHNVTFKFKKAKVKAGSQYVVFASIDQDYESCTDGYTVGWGMISDGDPYPGGGFVYQNNSGNEANWTGQPWNSFGTTDVAMKVYLK